MNINKLLPGVDMNLLRQVAKEIDKCNPGLRQRFENEVKNEVLDDELNELFEEVQEIFEHEDKP